MNDAIVSVTSVSTPDVDTLISISIGPDQNEPINGEADAEPEKKKAKVHVQKPKYRKLILNVSLTRYPVIRKVARQEFNMFLSNRDMFAPLNGQHQLDGKALLRDPDDDYFDIYWMDSAG